MRIMSDQVSDTASQTESDETSSRELLVRYKNGDSCAFRAIVERHTRYAYALSFRLLTDDEDAKDAVQEAFIRVWNHRYGFHEEMKFTTWLYRIVVNICYDKLRQRRRSWTIFKRSAESDEAEASTDGADLQRDVANRDLASQIRRIAGALPMKQRIVFILRDVQELSVSETAEVLNMSPAAVKTNLCFARRKIRDVLEPPEEKENQRP
jgi:RNA polymerase sigma-70 factor (ECF subfamily)